MVPAEFFAVQNHPANAGDAIAIAVAHVSAKEIVRIVPIVVALHVAARNRLYARLGILKTRTPRACERPGDILCQRLCLVEGEGEGEGEWWFRSPRNIGLTAEDHDWLAAICELDREPAGQRLDFQGQRSSAMRPMAR